ncbi:formate dehydrogenase accessory protein FdhE [Metapseudomonas resinovorans]|uniref:Protein FdhE homolog n=1 Tax=Metapseudomonas resinovorans NBRC 106553 TaxID=1245471 RepID=S6B0N8_METRE|nr:formate dehydrogenase accessory protein FdhE [Pseudomonas resinovorans]BAN50801.1 formate dehydrogenase accessory protein FdhE [Pseudomonas resinovorans NBRC 106553]
MSGQILEPGQIEAAANIPPFLHLPGHDLFSVRAARLRRLAAGHPLAGYLLLVAALCDAQQAVLDNPPALPGPAPEALARSREHGMPPFAFEALVRADGWLAVLDALLARFQAPNPEVAQAISQLREADAGQRKTWGVGLLSGQYDLIPPALAPFVGAALQVAFSHWLLSLPDGFLVESEATALCPACGSPPVSGMIRHRGKHNGLRYLACSLCSCEWHFVRLKCSHCQESKHLAHLSLEREGVSGEQAPIRAEACPNCQGYLKQCYLEFDPDAEAQADDLASLDLDLCLADEGYLRRAPNLLLAPGTD